MIKLDSMLEKANPKGPVLIVRLTGTIVGPSGYMNVGVFSESDILGKTSVSIAMDRFLKYNTGVPTGSIFHIEKEETYIRISSKELENTNE